MNALIEPLEDRSLLSATGVTAALVSNTASIAGKVFSDLNANGKLDTGEKPQPGVKIYIDRNKNGTLDTGETNVVTDSTGSYKFSSLAAGAYRVREVVPAGYKLKSPAVGYYDETLTTGSVLSGKNFANVPTTGVISGTVFNDRNSNGLFDSTESGAASWQVYIDANKNGKYDTGEIVSTTDASGKWYLKNVAAGTYMVRVTQKAGTVTTAPSSGVLSVVVAPGQTVAGKLFGERPVAQGAFVLQAPTITVASSANAQVISVPITLNYAAGALPFDLASVDFGLTITGPNTAAPLKFKAITSLLGSFAVAPTPSTTSPPPISSTIGFSASQFTGVALGGTKVTVATLQFVIPASTPVGTVYAISFSRSPDISDSAFDEPLVGTLAGSIAVGHA